MQCVCAILYWYQWPVWHCHILPDYPIQGTIFGGGELRILKCVSIFSTIWLKYFSFWEEFEILSQMYTSLHVKYGFFFSNFNETWIFSIDFRKILKYQFSQKSVRGGRGGGAELLLHADGLMDRHDDANTRFKQFLRTRLKTHIPFTVIDTCLDLNWWSIHTKGRRTAILQHMCII